MSIDPLSRILKENSADQYFFPSEYAFWEKETYRLPKSYKLEPDIGGVRFHEYDSNNPSIERACQHDLTNAVSALIMLRTIPEYENVVLKGFIKGTQNDNQLGKRIKFGFYNPFDAKYKDDEVAAKVSYHLIRKSISVSGFRLVHPIKIPLTIGNIGKIVQKIFEPDPFNVNTGLEGLKEWANHIKLKRKRYWWILIFLFPLLFLSLRQCDENNIFLGTPIRASSFIIMLDRSSSMGNMLSIVKKKTKEELDKIDTKSSWFNKNYANIISYNSSSYSAFGKLEPLNEKNIQKLVTFVEKQQADNGTCMRSAFGQAIEEIKLHNQPTTILLFTDGEDGCLSDMANLESSNKIKAQLNVKVIVNSATPRLLSSDVKDTQPINESERNMDAFSKAFDGNFGVIK